MINFFIYLTAFIVILFIVYRLTVKVDKVDYLHKFTWISKKHIEDIYNVCRKYSHLEEPLVEPSVKFSNRDLNYSRFTIPIFLGNFINNRTKSLDYTLIKPFIDEISSLVKVDLSNHFASVLSNVKSLSDENDVIIGYDWNQGHFKIYVDNARDTIKCIEIDLNSPLNYKTINKSYTKLSKDKYREVLHNIGHPYLEFFKILGFSERA